MKDKKECSEGPHPKPNLKNKKFVAWSRSELCRREDNIISSEWREKLQKTIPFKPVYDNAPVNMVYIMSGEYGRIWQRERDEWYAQVFVLNAKEKNMEDRKKKIRKEIKEAKKAAEINIKKRKERRATEIELKAKEDAEKMEKLKARITRLKSVNQKMPRKFQETRKQSTKSEISKKDAESRKSSKATTRSQPEEPKQEVCPKGYIAAEITLKCECSSHKDEQKETEPAKRESVKAESVKAESVKAESVKAESAKAESVKAESVKAECTKGEHIKAEQADLKNKVEKAEVKEEKPEDICQTEMTTICNHYQEQLKEIQKTKTEGAGDYIKKEPEEVKECCKPNLPIKQEKL